MRSYRFRASVVPLCHWLSKPSQLEVRIRIGTLCPWVECNFLLRVSDGVS